MEPCLSCGRLTRSKYKICSRHSASRLAATIEIKPKPMQTLEKRLKFLASEFSKLAHNIPSFDTDDKDEQDAYARVQSMLEGMPGVSFSRESSVTNFYEFDSAFSTDSES